MDEPKSRSRHTRRSSKSKVSLPIGTVVMGKYQLIEKIGSGGNGDIFKANCQESNVDVAVKELRDSSNETEAKRFVLEQQIYKELKGQASFPDLSQFYNCNSLWDSNVKCATETSHQRNSTQVLRDIKPDNMCIGVGPTKLKTVYLIDFGLARRFRANGKLIRRNRATGFRGTHRYVSLNVHENKDHTPVDDIISLFYSIVELSEGSLPWSKLRVSKEIAIKKKNVKWSELCRTQPEILFEFYEYAYDSCEDMNFPNYEHLMETLKKCLPSNFDDNSPMIYETRKNSLGISVEPSGISIVEGETEELTGLHISTMRSIYNQLPSQDDNDETSFPYFHGTQMDVDIDKLMQDASDGDFLIQAKHIAGSKKARNFLVVKGTTKVYRIEMKKNEIRQVRLKGKTFDNIGEMIEFHSKEPIEIDDEKILLRNGISRGKFHLYHRQIRIQKKIGEGSYGTVYRGILTLDNSIIAIKKLETEGTDDMAIDEMMKEARVMQLYDHVNIVKFYGFIVDRLPYLLVMEFCDGGAVEDKFKTRGNKISVSMRVDMLAQAAAGLEYLHSKECIHRDIAARNCLLHKNVLKLADFGMCRPTSVYKVDPEKPCNVRWLAPEVWKRGETRYNTDIYAFGIMMWEFFIIPYSTPYEPWKAYKVKPEVIKGFRLSPPDEMPWDLVKIMDQAWHQIPEKRPDAGNLRRKIDEVNKKINPYGVDVKARKSKSRLL